MPNSRPLPSLRTELLITLGILAAAALVIAVVTVIAVLSMDAGGYGTAFLLALITADVGVFLLFGAYQVDRLVITPMSGALESAEAIAAGDLTRRMPAAPNQELQALSTSVNRMTERLLAEHSRVIRAEKLASVGRLAAGLAHEIGNPLGAINGYVHIIRRGTGAEAGRIEAVDGLEREASRIDRIIRGLLDYARPRRLTPTRIDVTDAIREAVMLLTDQGVLRQIEVGLDIAHDPLPIFAERHDIDQIFVNLLLNAADAMQGSGKIAIYARRVPLGALIAPSIRRVGDPADIVIPREPNPRVRTWLDAARQPAEVIQVVVADDGPGVNEADVEKIFEPFFTTREPGKGTGLGLAIVARIVDNVSGTVWVQKAREGGAAFVLLFPVAQPGAALRAVKPSPSATAAAT